MPSCISPTGAPEPVTVVSSFSVRWHEPFMHTVGVFSAGSSSKMINGLLEGNNSLVPAGKAKTRENRSIKNPAPDNLALSILQFGRLGVLDNQHAPTDLEKRLRLQQPSHLENCSNNCGSQSLVSCVRSSVFAAHYSHTCRQRWFPKHPDELRIE